MHLGGTVMLYKVHDSWGVKPEDGADEILANANRRKNSTKKNLSDADGHFCACTSCDWECSGIRPRSIVTSPTHLN